MRASTRPASPSRERAAPRARTCSRSAAPCAERNRSRALQLSQPARCSSTQARSSGASSPSPRGDRSGTVSSQRLVIVVASSVLLPGRILAQVLAQLLLHLQASVEEAAHHRPLAYAESLRQFLVAQALHFAQQEDGAVVPGEALEGLSQLLLQLLVERRPLRTGQRRRGRVHGSLDLRLLRVAGAQRHPLAPSAPADRVEAQVGGDPVGPGEEGAVALERREVAMDPHERLLRDV